MLKTTVLSLLIGAVALVVVLTQFFGPTAPGGTTPPPLSLSKDTTRFTSSSGAFTDDGVTLEPRRGRAGVTLKTGGINAADYPFLHIAVDNPPRQLQTQLAFEIDGKKSEKYTLEHPSPTSIWLAMNEFTDWKGTVDSIEVSFSVLEKTSIHVTDLSLHPASSSSQLKAVLSDLSSFAPWKRAQMNTHTGVAKVASFYPVPLVVSLLLLSLAAYALIVLLTRRAFSWSDVGLIFLACWIGLDLVWQKRLTHQVMHSYHAFAGKTTEEKLASGPDGGLYQLAAKAKEHIESPDARVFVASDDLYRGMRSAYYLYPLNPYWKLEGPQLPESEFLRPGDYVLLVTPTRLRHSREKGIRRPETRYYPAETLFVSPVGRLVRLQ